MLRFAQHDTFLSVLRYSLFAILNLSFLAPAAFAQPDRVTLQYFEAQWNVMRRRMPDVFTSGYGAVWLPPPTKGQAGSSDIGYALFDRFDLGSSGAPTRYGTETDFRRLLADYHRAGIEVYVDWIMNHNGTLDHNTPGFIAQGSYPGFVVSVPGDAVGDFHSYANNCPQSTNPDSPCYNLYEGRLVGLVDLAQEKNHRYIRHPTISGATDNIPGGTLYNRPTPANAKFYPDASLPAQTVTNPGTSRNPLSPPWQFQIHPFNIADRTAGDPVIENATDLLLRSTQWMLEDVGVDGFRLDAAKHIQTWFWDNRWDAIVYRRYPGFDGVVRTPFSFVEVVEGGGVSMQDWVRRPGEPGSGQGWPPLGWEFGNRDALDLNEAGALRGLISAGGLGTWDNVLNGTIDLRDDGLQNGTMGIHHVTSHDNTIGEDDDDTFTQAFVLTRTGRGVVYHNAQQFGASPVNFPRNKSRLDALGVGEDLPPCEGGAGGGVCGTAIQRLVQIRNGYAHGWYVPINATDPVNPSVAEALVYVRRTPPSGANPSVDNLLIGISDRQDGAVEIRNVATLFPAGTRLHELTGNAADPLVDPNDEIPEILLVDNDGRLADAADPVRRYLRIPGNCRSPCQGGARGGAGHGRGYVIYGPAAPSGVLSVTNVAATLPPDDDTVPAYLRRQTPIDVIHADAFDIRLQTTPADPFDPNLDDNAIFRIDAGFRDANANGSIDRPTGFDAGYEDFLTQKSPRFGGGSGLYRQTIDATQLAEGLHYLSVWAYRHREAGDPIFTDFRKVILVDRLAPQVTLIAPTQTGAADITASSFVAEVRVDDPDVTRVHIFLDMHEATDFVALAQTGQGVAITGDAGTFRRAFSGAVRGNHRIDVVTLDSFGLNSLTSFVGINATTPFFGGLGDLDQNFRVDGDDLAPWVDLLLRQPRSFNPAADFNADGRNNLADLALFIDRLLAG